MSLLGTAKHFVNRILEPLNLRVETLTGARAEARRLEGLVSTGHFERPIFPVPVQFEQCDPRPVLSALERYRPELSRLQENRGPDSFAFDNPYFGSPDADVLYAMVRIHQPRQIVEVGSGNSTLVMRCAISDGKLATRLTSIDPNPRRQVSQYVDELIEKRVEDAPSTDWLATLEAGDILFIDSSHEIRSGNDVQLLFLRVLPSLPLGVIVHVHDIFLPYEYPKSWVVDHEWKLTEQYLVQAILQWGRDFEVLWPGYYLQKTLAGFQDNFPLRKDGNAQSIWFRRYAM